jgi:diacylglycerol kinase family enzyme
LGIPTDIPNACQTILQGNIQAVDLATCNGYPMLLLVGIGLEANAIEAASREAKDRFGILAYTPHGHNLSFLESGKSGGYFFSPLPLSPLNTSNL